jgi:GAF domain-containing protein
MAKPRSTAAGIRPLPPTGRSRSTDPGLRPDDLRALIGLARALSCAAGRAEAVSIAAEQMRRITGAARVLLWDLRAGGEAHLAAESSAMAHAGESGVGVPLALSSPEEDAFVTAEPVWIESRAIGRKQYPDLPPDDSEASAIFRAWAFLPLVADDQPDGILTLAYATDRAFDAGTRRFLCEAAAECASALAVGSLFTHEGRRPSSRPAVSP